VLAGLDLHAFAFVLRYVTASNIVGFPFWGFQYSFSFPYFRRRKPRVLLVMRFYDRNPFKNIDIARQGDTLTERNSRCITPIE
jgi:hypothetical protein